MLATCLLIAALIARGGRGRAQEDEGPYRGALIGKLNSYHHQVSGDVYAVDDWTVLLVNFNYDGAGDDAYFWAGDAGRPGPQGFIVPDQHGKTNILERYYNADVSLSLPEGKRLSRLKWLAVYDIASQNAFADVDVPDDFEAPAPRALAPLTLAPAHSGLSSQPLKLLDAATILIPEFRYDGSGEEVYFWAGVGPQPSVRGFKIPDEHGYLEPLRVYRGEDVTLTLPGGKTAFDVNWLAVVDLSRGAVLASALVPEAPRVPPAAGRALPHRAHPTHCKQLHRDVQLAWDVFGSQLTVQLAAIMSEDEYVSFGISGDAVHSVMLGADVAVCSWSARLGQGAARDYNVSARAPCGPVLGAWRGVCRDDRVGGLDSNQLLSASRKDGLTVLTYRRTLMPMESMDRLWPTSGAVAVVWAVGALDAAGEPAFHRLYPRTDLRLRLTDTDTQNDCFPFVARSPAAPAPWEVAELFDPALRVFHFRLGPAGGRRGVAGRDGGAGAGGDAPALAFYVNGQLAPDLQLRRGLTYTFKVYGGNDPHSASLYHPLVVTVSRRGAPEQLSPEAVLAARVLAGAARSRRGRLAPDAAGALCLARHGPEADRRRDDDYDSFRAYNRSLRWECAPGEAATLTVTPNASWPDLVYYNSFTHHGMGGRIYVVDRHRRNIGRKQAAGAPGAGSAAAPALGLLLLPLLAAAAL